MRVIKDQPYTYDECGLNVILLGITQYHCESCGEHYAAIPSPNKLHRLIGAHICRENKSLLLPAEVTFLRKELRLKAKDLAKTLGVSAESVSRWENGKSKIGEGHDRLLRSIYLMATNEGPDGHNCFANILEVFKELPHKRKEIKKPHSINLNPQEWLKTGPLTCPC